MDRYWFLTWTTYGTWLPGDSRGFVGDIVDEQGAVVRHNVPGTPYDADMPPLEGAARTALVGQPVWLRPIHAPVLLAQFQETAGYRGWQLLAAAVMANHVHLVVGVAGDPDPEKLLHDFKSYGTRALNQAGWAPAGARWWTRSGSRRKLKDEQAVRDASDYVVRRQSNPLLVWQCAGEPGVLTPGLATREEKPGSAR